MGGCASVDKMIPKFNLLPVRPDRVYTIGTTSVELYEEEPIKCQFEHIVIPIYEGGVFDSMQFGIPIDDRTKVENLITMLLNGAISERLKAGEIILVSVDGKFPEEPYKSIKNIIFVPIPNSPSFARERLAQVLLEIFRKAEEAKLPAVLIPKLTRSGQIGTADTEVASITAKTVQLRFARQPTTGQYVLPRVAFGTSDKKYLVDLQRSFNEALGLKESDTGDGVFGVQVPGAGTVKNMFKF